MNPSQRMQLEGQARKIVASCDEQLEAAQERATQQGVNVNKMFTMDGKLLVAQTILAKSNALLTIAMVNQSKEK
jgi:hypothetical protein